MTLTEADFPSIAAASPAGIPFDIEPPGRPELAFRLHLPSNWASEPSVTQSPGDGSAWTTLGAFAEKPGAESPTPPPQQWAAIMVLWRRLEFEVPLDEWVAVELGGMQVDIAMARILHDARGLVVDAGGTCMGALSSPNPEEPPVNLQLVVRAIVRADGRNVFAVWCTTTPEAYPAVRDHVASAGASFVLLHPAGGSSEALACAQAADPAFDLVYPSSWLHQPVETPPTVSGKKSALGLVLAEEQLLKAYIRVKAVDLRQFQPESVEALLQDATGEMAQAGVAPQGPWVQLQDPMLLSIAGLHEAYTAPGLLQDVPYELHFGIAVRPPLLFCVTALVLPLQADARMSMRGHRAYAMVLESAVPRQM
jgi:hypothetical protein